MTNFEPVLSGWLKNAGGQTILKAKFGAPLLTILFIVATYLLLPIFVYLILSGELPIGDPSLRLIFLALIAVFAFLPHLMHFLFNRNADAHLDSILHLLETEVGLVQVMPDVAASED